MINKMNIRRKFLLRLLLVGILALVVLGSVSLWGLYGAQRDAMERGRQMGAGAGSSIEGLTVYLAQKQLFAATEEKAHLVDRELRTIKEDTEYIAMAMERILSTPEGRIPKPVRRAEDKTLLEGETYVYYSPDIRDSIAQAALSDEIGVASCISDELENTASSYLDYKGFLCVASEKGYYFSAHVSFKDQQEVELSDVFISNYAPRETAWYKNAARAGESTVIDMFWGENTHLPFISCSVPYNDGKEFAGVANISISAPSLYQVMEDEGKWASGINFALNDKGEIVFSSEKDGLLSVSEEKQDLRQSSEPDLVKKAEGMVDGKSGVDTVNLNGEAYYLAYVPIPSVGWSFGTLIRAGDVVTPVQEVRGSVSEQEEEFALTMTGFFQENIWKRGWLLLFILAVLVVTGRALAEQFGRPIIALTDDAREISGGNLEKELNISTGDEIEELSWALVEIKQKLKETITDIDNTTAEKQRIASELSAAHSIQKSMLPMAFPKSAVGRSYEVFAVMDAAGSASSAFCDFYMLDKERLAITVANVSESGIPAALFKMIAKAVLKNNAMAAVRSGGLEAVHWGKVMAKSNLQLCKNNDKTISLKAFFGVLNIVTGEFVYVNCGHDSPLICRISEEKFTWHYMEDENESPPMGAVENAIYEEERLLLCHGDMLCCCTDGVIGDRDEEGRPNSREQLLEKLNRLIVSDIELRQLLNDLMEDVALYAHGTEQPITMLGLRYL